MIDKPKVSRTNREMSEATKAKIIDATLFCLAKNGYAGTSTNDVVKRAGVTRGALTHHYASKAELVAEAAVEIVRRRQGDQDELIAQVGKIDFEGRLRGLHAITEKHFPAMIEFMIAARTDEILRERFTEAIMREFSQENGRSETLFPEFSSRPDPTMTHYVVNCFFRGVLCETIVNPDEKVAKMIDEFIDILRLALSRR